MAAIVIGSALSDPLTVAPLRFDATGFGLHIIEFAVLGFLLTTTLCASLPGYDRRFIIALAVLVASAYACTDELHQAFVPGRVSDALDLLADSIGSMTGAALATGVQHWRRRTGRKWR